MWPAPNSSARSPDGQGHTEHAAPPDAVGLERDELYALRKISPQQTLRPQQSAAAAVLPQHQPAPLMGGEPLCQGRGQRLPRRILRRDELEMGRHVAAAHHADIAAGGGGGVQQKIVDGRALLLQQGHGHLLAAALYGSAADGTGEPSIGTHQHLRAALPGSAARCVDQRHQHRVPVLLHLIKQLCKDLIHSFSLFHCRIRLRRRR